MSVQPSPPESPEQWATRALTEHGPVPTDLLAHLDAAIRRARTDRTRQQPATPRTSPARPA